MSVHPRQPPDDPSAEPAPPPQHIGSTRFAVSVTTVLGRVWARRHLRGLLWFYVLAAPVVGFSAGMLKRAVDPMLPAWTTLERLQNTVIFTGLGFAALTPIVIALVARSGDPGRTVRRMRPIVAEVIMSARGSALDEPADLRAADQRWWQRIRTAAAASSAAIARGAQPNTGTGTVPYPVRPEFGSAVLTHLRRRTGVGVAPVATAVVCLAAAVVLALSAVPLHRAASGAGQQIVAGTDVGLDSVLRKRGERPASTDHYLDLASGRTVIDDAHPVRAGDRFVVARDLFGHRHAVPVGSSDWIIMIVLAAGWAMIALVCAALVVRGARAAARFRSQLGGLDLRDDLTGMAQGRQLIVRSTPDPEWEASRREDARRKNLDWEPEPERVITFGQALPDGMTIDTLLRRTFRLSLVVPLAVLAAAVLLTTVSVLA